MSFAASSFVSRYLAGWLLLLGLCQTTAWAAEPPNTMGQRMQACASCHGKEGRASNSGYLPRIAGKPAGYLYNQLINFRDGRRQNATMAYLLDHMSDQYLMDIANHFASLDLPYPPAQTIKAPAATLARGEQLVRHGDATRGVPACAGCHGAAMTGVVPAMPGLVPHKTPKGNIHSTTNGHQRRRQHWPSERTAPGFINPSHAATKCRFQAEIGPRHHGGAGFGRGMTSQPSRPSSRPPASTAKPAR